MIKFETVGMYDDARNNPTLKSDVDVKNHSFVTIDGILYFIENTIVGDNAYREGIVIPAGEFLRGYDVRAFEGQKLVVDGKHVTGGIETLKAGDILVAAEDGTLKAGTATGVHFVVTDNTVLTEDAIKVRVAIAPASAGTGA